MEKTNKPNRLPGLFIGCVVWFMVLGAMLSCILPVAIFGGLMSGFLATDQVAKIVGPILCPADTTPYIHTFPTTSTDENGFETPSTGYEMLCRQKDGTSVDPSFDYQFTWIGILTLASVILSVIIAILIAGPMGIVVNKLWDRMKVKRAV
jgi:hypothetical protein